MVSMAISKRIMENTFKVPICELILVIQVQLLTVFQADWISYLTKSQVYTSRGTLNMTPEMLK